MKLSPGLIYKRLYARFGPQYWWPGNSSFEVSLGAILTQNTNWFNVEKAIRNLKKNKLLEPRKLYSLTSKKIALLIKSSGYYNIKAKRLKEFLKFLIKSYKGSMKEMSLADTHVLRRELLCVNGIGPETADSILLYALGRPVFVVDAYTKRILARHCFVKEDAGYDVMQNFFMKNLTTERGKYAKLFNEFHALLVKLGKEFCLKNKPKCNICPLADVNRK